MHSPLPSFPLSLPKYNEATHTCTCHTHTHAYRAAAVEASQFIYTALLYCFKRQMWFEFRFSFTFLTVGAGTSTIKAQRQLHMYACASQCVCVCISGTYYLMYVCMYCGVPHVAFCLANGQCNAKHFANSLEVSKGIGRKDWERERGRERGGKESKKGRISRSQCEGWTAKCIWNVSNRKGWVCTCKVLQLTST